MLIFNWSRNSSGHVTGAKSSRSVWRTSFDPKLIPKQKTSLNEGIIDDNPADPHTMKYELGLIDLFQNTSNALRNEGKGFGIVFATTRRLVGADEIGSEKKQNTEGTAWYVAGWDVKPLDK